MSPFDVIEFWWGLGEDGWFRKDEQLDQEMRDRFSDLHHQALNGSYREWESGFAGRLALVLLLDQFSRNMFRGTSDAYSGDQDALRIARLALEAEDDRALPMPHRRSYYMPFMHSEDLEDHTVCIDCHERLGDANGLKWAKHHADIVRTFGRFPHRNAILGRTSSPDEEAFIKKGGFAG
ncbi:DUF924 family protein [Coralliovum pocilloporae]|uniref:DUF924 family protein n=1 Tax=Coralliovum pocilloporae TaxID=3066369 RepID=UPI003307B3BF